MLHFPPCQFDFQWTLEKVLLLTRTKEGDRPCQLEPKAKSARCLPETIAKRAIEKTADLLWTQGPKGSGPV